MAQGGTLVCLVHFVWRPHSVVFRNYSWFYTQESFLMAHRTILDTRNRTRISCMQTKCPTHYTIVSALGNIFCHQNNFERKDELEI